MKGDVGGQGPREVADGRAGERIGRNDALTSEHRAHVRVQSWIHKASVGTQVDEQRRSELSIASRAFRRLSEEACARTARPRYPRRHRAGAEPALFARNSALAHRIELSHRPRSRRCESTSTALARNFIARAWLRKRAHRCRQRGPSQPRCLTALRRRARSESKSPRHLAHVQGRARSHGANAGAWSGGADLCRSASERAGAMVGEMCVRGARSDAELIARSQRSILISWRCSRRSRRRGCRARCS